jgi:hypothetical protein
MASSSPLHQGGQGAAGVSRNAECDAAERQQVEFAAPPSEMREARTALANAPRLLLSVDQHLPKALQAQNRQDGKENEIRPDHQAGQDKSP